jgi:alpha-galactosidase
MASTALLPEEWVDAFLQDEPFPTITYRSSLTTYEESFIRGQLVGRAWNGSGHINAWDDGTRLDPTKHPTPQAFWLEIDGQLLHSHWEWQNFERIELPNGLQTTLILKHQIRPIQLKIHTVLDGTSVLMRWLEVTNIGSNPAALGAISPWSGVLQVVNRWANHVHQHNTPLFELGYMNNTRWGDEGHFQWHALPNANYRVDGHYRRDRFRHPMFVLRNNATGEHFIGQLGWSGGYSFEFDLDADPGTHEGSAKLFFRAGPDAPAPLRVIAPGETIKSPTLHLGLNFGDLDTSIQAMHDHFRRSVFGPYTRNRSGWIESGIGPELEITSQLVYEQIDNAAAIGSELFFIDASWYAEPNSHWWDTVGDWQVDLKRFPEGVEPFRQYAHSKGMLFGLWMDAERVGKKSWVALNHPEWLATAYDGQQRLGNMLDLTNPDCAKWMEEQISRVIGEYKLDFFRLDYNVGNIGPSLMSVRDGYIENGYWRYYEALYAIYSRLRERYPDVIFETCASGGGRTDVEWVRHFTHTWVTDWQIAPRSFSITNGMSMALPPEYVDRLIGGQNGHTTAELDFQNRLLLFVRPSIAPFHPQSASRNPVQIARIRHMTDLYKQFVRPMHANSRIYHHTPDFADCEPHGWGVLELAAKDHSRAIAGIFQLSAPHEREYTFRPRGLDISKRYKVTFDNRKQSTIVDGYLLAQQGIIVRLEGALTSELLCFEVVE